METLRNTDALSSRTQNLLNGYSSKRKSAQQNSETETKNYDEVFARISQQTSERINRLKSTMSPDQLAKINIQKKYSQPIIPANIETKTYTGAAEAPEAEAETAAAVAETKISAYKEKIDNMAAKRNVTEKFKNRDIDAEIDALISKKLTGANGESLSIRSDLPTVIKNYEVKQGDTLAGISKNFYKDAFMFKNISTVNEIKAPYKLSEGQNLRIVFHQVQAGENETLESIAEKYTQNKISPKTLAKLNDKEEIAAGDTLLIPVQFSAAGEAPVQTAEQPEKIQRFHLSKNTGDASLEETKRQIEKYASQIERLNF
ncbi:MAG TPA: LysM domain-containing protein [Candidatus Wallbacteria bacterium]|nr:LysM domain-containing protein [Candidatus Wallbacteria bacterium]